MNPLSVATLPELVAQYHKEGMTAAEAEAMRDAGATVHACWFCLRRRATPLKAYWFEQDLEIKEGEHINRCPLHRETRE